MSVTQRVPDPQSDSRSRGAVAPRPLRYLLASFVLYLGLANCEEHSWERPSGCRPACSDPQCTAFDVCKLDGDCPIGTACLENVCRPPTNADLSSSVLLEGFASDEIQLARTVPGSFSVEAPKAADKLTCALLVGTPVFQDHSLSNFEASAARYRVFPLDPTRSSASTLSLRLDDLMPFAGTDCAQGAALNTGNPSLVLVESLHLGCWAMSLDAIVGATSVLSLDPTELPEYAETPLESCNQSESATDGSSCVLSSQIGTCQRDMCVANAGSAPADLGAAGATAAAETCNQSANGTPCEAGSPGRGRCFGGNCLTSEEVLLPPLVTARCTTADQWQNCFPSPLGLIGTCYNQLCRQRCHDVIDCNGDVCTYPDTPSYLGVCTGSKEQTP
jgi:hypothetical protein